MSTSLRSIIVYYYFNGLYTIRVYYLPTSLASHIVTAAITTNKAVNTGDIFKMFSTAVVGQSSSDKMLAKTRFYKKDNRLTYENSDPKS